MGARDEAPMWDDIPALVELGWFESALANLASLKQEKAQLEIREKELQQEVESALVIANVKRVRWSDKFCVEQSNGRVASKINAKLLAAAGVSAEIIAQCTIAGDAYTYVQMIDLTKKNAGGPPSANAE